jgi:hypothetical protein
MYVHCFSRFSKIVYCSDGMLTVGACLYAVARSHGCSFVMCMLIGVLDGEKDTNFFDQMIYK